MTKLPPHEDWRPGQTVVLRDERGWRVARLLVVKSREGWRCSGLAREEFDPVPVTPRNSLGTVTKAYELVPLGPRLTPLPLLAPATREQRRVSRLRC